MYIMDRQLQFGLNSMQHPDASKNNRGYVETVSAETFEECISQEWVKDTVNRIRNGESELKEILPWYTPHYWRFRNNHRSQADADPEAFTFRTCVDIDEEAVVEDAKRIALLINDDEDSPWHGLVDRIWYSSRKKLHIDLRMPVGLTIEETQHLFCKAIDVPYDSSATTPERFIYLTSKDDEIYRSPKFMEMLSEEEIDLRRKAYQRRGLTIDGRKMKTAGSKKAPGEVDSADKNPAPTDEQTNVEARQDEAWSLWQEAERLAGVELASAKEGERHETLKRILSKSGLAQVLTREELEECVSRSAPEYYADDYKDMSDLLRDFSERYIDIPVKVGADKGTTGAVSAAKAFTPRRDDYSCPMIFRPTCKTQLPEGLRQCVASVSNPDLWIPTVVATIVACGANIPQISATDPMGYTHPVGLLSAILWGESGAGKSEVLRCVNLLSTAMREEDAQARKKRKAYKELKKGRKASTALPPAPTDPICELPLDSTPSARAERAELAEPTKRILFTVSDEGGAILNSSEKFESWQLWYNAGWAEETIQIARSSDDSVEAYISARLSCVMAAQPVYKPLIASTIPQGMASRIMNVVLHKDKPGPLTPLKPISEKNEQAIIDLARRLRALPELQLDLPKLRHAMKHFEEEAVKKAVEQGDLVMQDDGIRGRIMTSAYRMGCILTACWMVDPKAGKKGGDSNLVIDQCLMLADYLSDTFTMLFRADVERFKSGDLSFLMSAKGPSEAKAGGVKKTANDKILEALPEEFTKADLKAKKPKASDSTLRGLIKTWIDARRIARADGGKFRKQD